jgi:serine/threonine protein kinase
MELATHGTLDKYLCNDLNYPTLSTETRLSIMYQLARSIHFLHSGGCGYIVYHRDIKPSNICLTNNYTVKLIDCGLAKIVLDDEKQSPASSIKSTTFARAVVGTEGYICPDYKQKGNYTAASDVYSLGVVFVELILGVKQNSERDFFFKYVCDDQYLPRSEPAKMLQNDADPNVEWPTNVLSQVCDSALGCMSFSSVGRPKAGELASKLSQLRYLHFATSNNFDPSLEADTQQLEDPNDGVPCKLCHKIVTAGVWCSNADSHWTCTACLVNVIHDQVDKGGNEIKCAIEGCLHGKFTDDQFFRKIPKNLYNLYVRERTKQKRIDDIWSSMTSLQKNQAFLATEDVKKCPRLVWMIPAERSNAKSVRQWITSGGMKSFHLYFICEHSLTPVEPPIVITAAKGWVLRVAPALKVALFVLQASALAHGIPIPFSVVLPEPLKFLAEGAGSTLEAAIAVSALQELPFPGNLTESTEKLSLMNDFVDSILKDRPEGQDLNTDNPQKTYTLVGESYKTICEKTDKAKHSEWKNHMTPVWKNGTIIWVKKEYQHHYLQK